MEEDWVAVQPFEELDRVQLQIIQGTITDSTGYDGKLRQWEFSDLSTGIFPGFLLHLASMFRIPFFTSCAVVFLTFTRLASSQDTKPEVPPPSPEPDRRPNIVLIIADDLGWDDTSPYGHESIATPNIKRLADEGMKFELAFVTASSCSPSRASLITGQFPTTTDADELHWPVPKEKITFVEKLKASGYWTGAAGKWHLGDELKDRFDKIYEADSSGFQLPVGAGAAGGLFQETLSGEAQSGCGDWMKLMDDRAKDKPFFLWLAALDPHRPYHEGTVSNGATAESVKIPPYHPDTPEVRKDYQSYYDEIIRLDKNVGMVLDKLKDQGVEDNTLVCFLSDNGRPFPRDKTTLFDSGIRTPLLVRWPGTVKAGGVCGELISTVDIAKTFLSVAKIESIGPHFKGQSFLPQLTDPTKPGREYIYAEKNWHDYEDHSRAVRNKRYKYIRNYYDDLPLTPPSDAVRSLTYDEMKRLAREEKLLPHQLTCFVTPRDKEELYDTVADPFELNNVAADTRYASVVLAMRAALKGWETANGDAPPALRTADEFDRVSGLPNAARVRPRRTKAQMVELNLTAP